MPSSKENERIFLRDCISLYRGLPALWDIQSQEYRDRQKKNDAYDILVNKYREKYPDADREEVKKKFNSLRTNFRKELKKIAGSDTSDVYESNLWYFQEMQFLRDQKSLQSGSNTLIDEEEEYSSSKTMWNDSLTYDLSCQPPAKKKSKSDGQEFFPLTCNYLGHANDDFLKLTTAWAVELQNMHPIQQMFAKKAINDIIFEGQIGTLHRHSVVINAPPSEPSIPQSNSVSNTDSSSDYHLNFQSVSLMDKLAVDT